MKEDRGPHLVLSPASTGVDSLPYLVLSPASTGVDSLSVSLYSSSTIMLLRNRRRASRSGSERDGNVTS